jgi:hypothetical protein
VLSRKIPNGLDSDTTQRVIRTFLLVRIVRGALVLLFVTLALLGVVVRGWPLGVAVALGLTLLLQVGRVIVNCRRFARTGRHTHPGPAIR